MVRSIIAPNGFTFLYEGGHAFLRIGSQHIFHHDLAGHFISVVQVHVHLSVEGFLANSNRVGGLTYNQFREMHDRIIKFVVGHMPVD